MSHKCVLCNKPLLERPVLVLKTISIICIDCVEKVKSFKETPAKAPKKLFLKIDPKVAHLAVRAGVMHDGSGLMTHLIAIAPVAAMSEAAGIPTE